MIRFALPLAAAGLALTGGLAAAQTASSNYDGTWVVIFPSAGFIERSSDFTCPAMQWPVTIVNGQIQGELHQVPTRDGNFMVAAGGGQAAAPITGTVGSDGAFTAEWQGFHALGQLGPQSGEVTVKGECGPITGTATRITAMNTPVAGSGSSVPGHL